MSLALNSFARQRKRSEFQMSLAANFFAARQKKSSRFQMSLSATGLKAVRKGPTEHIRKTGKKLFWNPSRVVFRDMPSVLMMSFANNTNYGWDPKTLNWYFATFFLSTRHQELKLFEHNRFSDDWPQRTFETLETWKMWSWREPGRGGGGKQYSECRHA